MPAFDKTRPMPSWLALEHDAPRAPGYQRGVNYYRKLWHGQLPGVDPAKIRAVYAEAKRLTAETGVRHEVDHIYPLIHPSFCGLHVPWNLQILPADANRRHSNNMHPDHPQRDLFENWIADEYFELKHA